MPPKTKIDEPVVGCPPPGNLRDLCTHPDCEPRELDPTTSQVSCPHGSWFFVPGEPEPGPSVEEQVATALDELTVEELQALLDAKTAPPVVESEPAKTAPPAK